MGTLLVVRNLKNTNSGFKLIAQDQSIEVTEFSETSISFHIPSDHFVPGMLVSMDFILHMQEGLAEFEATGKVSNVEATDAKTNRIKITLHQLDKKAWTKFLEQLKNKQNHIDELLASMKGEE
jgi:hypothetical protein